MNVVHLSGFFDEHLGAPGELFERYRTLTGWARALREAGASKVTVIQRWRESQSFSEGGVDYELVRSRRGSGRLGWWAASALSKVLDRVRPDLVHVHGLSVVTWLPDLRGSATGPVLLAQHHAEPAPTRFWRRSRLIRALRPFDAIAFAARGLGLRWVREGLVLDGQVVELAEAGASLSPVACAPSAGWSATGRPSIAWVGRLNANKDPLTVLDGFALAKRELPHARLTMIYGDDELLPRVRARVEGDVALAGAVDLRGVVSPREVAEVLSRADLYVSGSHQEGSGYALMEALVCGSLPVVTDIPSFWTLTGEGSVGRLWPPGNAIACARALVDAARDISPATRAIVRRFGVERFTWPAVAASALALYATLCERRRRS